MQEQAVKISRDGNWSLTNPPPGGHPDVAGWAWNLFIMARDDRIRLGMPDIWIECYNRYRGFNRARGNQNSNLVKVNLFFANVERTTANITARNPVFEIIDLDGNIDESDKLLTISSKKWWNATKQKRKLNTTSRKMEKYGVTIEKSVWDPDKKQADVIIVDPFAFFPAPGKWEDISADCPFIAHATPEATEAIEKQFGIEEGGVFASDVYSILGEDRDDYRDSIISSGSAAHYGNQASNVQSKGNLRQGRALVVEVWVRDFTEESTGVFTQAGVDEVSGEPILEEQVGLKYPGGVRVISVTNNGALLLSDIPNPNVNMELPRELTAKTFLNDRFPFEIANSYEDSMSVWGFSAATQVGPLNSKIEMLLSRMILFLERKMHPPLIIPEGIGISRTMINTKPNLILMPNDAALSQYIRYVPVPDLPASFFNAFDLLVSLFDRIYQIEDADRGQAPNGVIAAAGIIALQERNAVLIQDKIASVDGLVEFRGKCFLSMVQNFGYFTESVDFQDTTAQFRGIDLVGRNYSFAVEAGSTMPKTSVQLRADAQEAFKLGAIDRQAYLEAIDFPGAKAVIERMGEDQLGNAMQVLIQAGFPEDQAMQLYQMLMQGQGGPGNRPQTPPQGQAGGQPQLQAPQ